MASIEAPIGLGYGKAYSLPWGAQTCENLMPQGAQTVGTVTTQALYNTPGIKAWGTAGLGPNRGGISVDDVPFWVSGAGLYTANTFGKTAYIGAIEGTGRCSLAGNGQVVAVIVPGVAGYFATESTVTKISDATFLGHMGNGQGGVTSVTYVSGYFVYSTKKEFFVGSVRTDNDGQDFIALHYSSADSAPDKIVGVFAHRNELYVMGSQSIQLFRAIATPDFPFASIQGADIPKGLISQFAVAEFNNAFVFVGGALGDPVSVWRGLVSNASKISTTGVDEVLRSYTRAELEGCHVSTYGEAGGVFAVISLARHTLVYDAESSQTLGRHVWHTRKTTGSTAWDVGSVIYARAKNLAASSIDGKIGELTLNAHQEFGVTPVREFTGPYFQDETNALFFSEVELVAESGVGLPGGSASGVNPSVSLEISQDGGRTFSAPLSRDLGQQGSYNARMRWFRLGRVPVSALLRFRTTEPVKIAFSQLVAQAKSGRRAA